MIYVLLYILGVIITMTVLLFTQHRTELSDDYVFLFSVTWPIAWSMIILFSAFILIIYPFVFVFHGIVRIRDRVMCE